MYGVADGGAGSVADMNRLVLSLWLVAAVYPGYPPNFLQPKQEVSASAGRLAELGATSDLSGPESLPPITEAQSLAIQRVALRSPTTVLDTVLDHAQSTSPPPPDHQSGKPSAPLPSTPDSSEPSVPDVSEDSHEEANWVVVIRAATEHSGPSVSAPTVRYYPVGTELHLIGYEQGWFQVLDPVTSQRGWIYEKYYLQAIRGPGQMVALQEPAKPQQKVVNARKTTPHVRRAKSLAPRLAKKIQPLIASAPRYRYETVASILDRALRP